MPERLGGTSEKIQGPKTIASKGELVAKQREKRGEPELFEEKIQTELSPKPTKAIEFPAKTELDSQPPTTGLYAATERSPAAT